MNKLKAPKCVIQKYVSSSLNINFQEPKCFSFSNGMSIISGCYLLTYFTKMPLRKDYLQGGEGHGQFRQSFKGSGAS